MSECLKFSQERNLLYTFAGVPLRGLGEGLSNVSKRTEVKM